MKKKAKKVAKKVCKKQIWILVAMTPGVTKKDGIKVFSSLSKAKSYAKEIGECAIVSRTVSFD